MKNITVSISEDVYRTARIWAAENGVSVSAAVKYFLTTLPQRQDPSFIKLVRGSLNRGLEHPTPKYTLRRRIN